MKIKKKKKGRNGYNRFNKYVCSLFDHWFPMVFLIQRIVEEEKVSRRIRIDNICQRLEMELMGLVVEKDNPMCWSVQDVDMSME